LSFDAITNKTQDKSFKHKVEILLAQVCLKDQTAFESLYQGTSPKLYGLILKMIQDKDIAADILQESFNKIWHQAPSYRSDLGENWAWAWMCQITRNTALDHIRKVNRRPESPLEETDINQITDEGMAIAEQRDLNYCLNQLKQEPRRVIVLAYVHGFSHSELADKLSTPIGTLKSWIRRGLKELELCLKN